MTTVNAVATNNVVDLFGVKFDRNAPSTYFIFLGLLTVLLILLANKNPSLALGLAGTVLLAVAFSHR